MTIATIAVLLCTVFLVVYRVAFAEICTNNVCKYTFTIRRQQTMTYRSAADGRRYDVIMNKTVNKLQVVGNTYYIDDDIIGSYVSPEDVITADGFRRHVMMVNDQFPGPTIEIMEGAQVEVTLVNKLSTDTVTVHWHGMYMENNLWMDGSAYVTQCPILPHQSFVYRFVAEPAGTHWYHSHNANQRLDGLYGALIVHKHTPSLPYYILTVQDWSHVDAESLQISSPYHLEHPGSGTSYLHFFHRHSSLDGTELTAVTYVSTLINGRGSNNYTSDAFPLHRFDIESGSRYRFRTIHPGSEYVYEVKIDKHKLEIVASDGHDLEPFTVDSFIIFPGETFDFEIHANQTPGIYYIRAETLRYGIGLFPKPDGIKLGGRAVLRYDQSKVASVSSENATSCTPWQPCVVFNCPFPGYPDNMNKMCISFDDIKARDADYRDYGIKDTDFEEIFLNVGFNVGSTINGIRYMEPTAPLFGDIDKHITPCKEENCANGCKCTNIQELPFNRTIQLVLFSQLSQSLATLGHHPMHLHGYSFAVMKTGFPNYNHTSGLVLKPNEDIKCKTGLFCPDATWRETPPLLNVENPAIKDTVTIPARGYVVIRFRTLNPGFWMFHCHSETHLMEGMSLIFSIAPDKLPKLPPNFPQCGNFDWDMEDFTDSIDGIDTSDRRGETTTGSYQKVHQNNTLLNILTGFCFGSLVLLALITLLVIIVKVRKRSKKVTPKEPEKVSHPLTARL